MRYYLIKFLSCFMQSSFGTTLCKLLTRNTPRVLMYHRFSDENRSTTVSAEQFEEQVKRLKKDFNVMSLDSLVATMASKSKLLPNIIVLTIDDGYRDFYQVAYPVLTRHSVPATLFVTTSFVDQTCWLWPDKVEYILEGVEDKSVITNYFDNLYFGENYDDLWKTIIEYLIKLPNRRRLETIDDLSVSVGVSFPEQVPEKFSAVTWGQVEEMLGNGIGVGSHTLTHPILSTVEDNVDLEKEIIESKNIIENKLSIKANSFCFPNGQAPDFNDEILTMVKKAGYACAVRATFDNDLYSDIYTIGRISAGVNMSQFEKSAYGYEILSMKVKRYFGL